MRSVCVSNSKSWQGRPAAGPLAESQAGRMARARRLRVKTKTWDRSIYTRWGV